MEAPESMIALWDSLVENKVINPDIVPPEIWSRFHVFNFAKSE